MTPRPCKDVRDLARRVIEQQSIVELCADKLTELTKLAPEIESEDSVVDDRSLALEFVFGAVNWRFFDESGAPYSAPSNSLTGSASMRLGLAEAQVDWTDPNAILALSSSDWSNIAGSNLCDLNRRFSKLKCLAEFLKERNISCIAEYLKREHDGEALLSLLCETGLFEDPFLKRAQSTVFDVSLKIKALHGSHYKGIEEFTLLADYRLIQLFLEFGLIFNLSSEVEHKIKERHLFQSTDFTPLVLRAAVVHFSDFLSGDPAVFWDKRFWRLSKALEAEKGLSYPPINVNTDEY